MGTRFEASICTYLLEKKLWKNLLPIRNGSPLKKIPGGFETPPPQIGTQNEQGL